MQGKKNEVNHVNRHKREDSLKLDVQELKRIWYCLMYELKLKKAPLPYTVLALGKCEIINDIKRLFNFHVHNELDFSYFEYIEQLNEFKKVVDKV